MTMDDTRYEIPPQLQMFRTDAGLFFFTEAGMGRFGGADVGVLVDVVEAAAKTPRHAELVELLSEEIEPEAVAQCLRLLCVRGVLRRVPSDGGRSAARAQLDPSDADGWSGATGFGHDRIPQVLVIGDGPLVSLVEGACTDAGADVVTRPFPGSDVVRAAYERRREGLAFPRTPETTPKLGSDPGLAEAIAEADLVVVGLDGALLVHLFELRDLATGVGTPVLPVVGGGERLVVGPLLVEETSGCLESLYVDPAAAGRGVPRSALGLVRAPEAPEPGPGMRHRLARVLARAMHDRSGSLAWMRFSVSDTELEVEPVQSMDFLNPAAKTPTAFFPNYLNSSIFGDERRLARIRDELRRNRLVGIRNAFDPGFADLVHSRLDAVQRWNTEVKHDPAFQFRYRDCITADLVPPLKSLWGSLFNERSRRWMEELCGRPCDGNGELISTWYMAGDYATLHTDGGNKHSIALVWHLSRDWQEGWGGDFIWCASGSSFPPTFNSLFMFRVDSSTSMHAIAPVSPTCTGKRLTVVMWWGCKDEEPWNRTQKDREGTVAASCLPPRRYDDRLLSLPSPSSRIEHPRRIEQH